MRVMPHLLDAVDDRGIREFVGETLGRRLTDIELAPLLGRAIAALMADGFYESLLDRLLEFCRRFLEQREEQLYSAATAQRRRWWIPRAVNRQVAKAIVNGIKELLTSVREPGALARRNLLEGIGRFAEELGTSPEYRRRVEDLKLRLLQDDQAQAWLSSAWGDIKHALLATRFSGLEIPPGSVCCDPFARSAAARRCRNGDTSESHDRGGGNRGNSVAC